MAVQVTELIMSLMIILPDKNKKITAIYPKPVPPTSADEATKSDNINARVYVTDD